MSVLGLGELVGLSGIGAAWMLGIFGWGRRPDEETVLDREEVAATLRLGLDDLCDADRRGGGWSRVDPSITIEDVELAAKMEEALRGRR